MIHFSLISVITFIHHILILYSRYLQVLETFVVEGQEEDELPERALVAFACINVTMDKSAGRLRTQVARPVHCT